MKRILDGVERLTAMPQTVLEAVRLLQQDSVSAEEIENVLRRDEALSVEVLRWANSARYGSAGSVLTLRASVVRLGRAKLLRIVLQHKLGGLFASAGSAYGLQRGALWRSALGGAIASEQLAHREGSVPPDQAFLCGLVRDIGKLAFDASLGANYFEQVRKHCTAKSTFVDAERKCFGFDHAQLGGELAIRWGLPVQVAQAITNHHAPPPDAPHRRALFDIVHAADVICMWAGLAIGHDGLQYEFDPRVRQCLNIDQTGAEGLILDVWCQLREIEELMSVSPSTSTRAS